MDDNRLEMSATPPASYWKENWKAWVYTVLACGFAVSLISNCTLREDLAQADRDRTVFAQQRDSEKLMRESLVEQQDKDRAERRQLVSTWLMGEEGLLGTFQQASPEWVEVFRECERYPFDLKLAPRALGFVDRKFSPHNPEPMRNEAGVWFASNETCMLNQGAVLRIDPTVEKDRYLVRVEYPAPDLSRDACPTGAYRLVLKKNEYLQQSVRRECYIRTKLTQLGAPLGMPDHALSR